MQAKYLRICPYGKKHLQQMMNACYREILWLIMLTVPVVLIWNSMLGVYSPVFFLESVFLAVYLIGMEVPNFKIAKKENEVYRELLTYFSRVKHCYMACHHISNAVMNAADGMSYEVQRLAECVYRILTESNRKETVRSYILYQQANEYLKLFLLQAYEASEKGDAFLCDNMEHLRLELMEELYRRKKRAHEFSGYVFVSVAPFFMMPLLRSWGLEFAPELSHFYTGAGMLLETITFLITLLIYRLISTAKEITLYEKRGEKLWNDDFFFRLPVVSSLIYRFERAEGKISNNVRKLIVAAGEKTCFGKICVEMLVVILTAFWGLTSFNAISHQKERRMILERVESIDVIAPVAGDEKKAMLSGHILWVTKEYKNKSGVTVEEIRALLRERIRLGNEAMELMAVQEIQEKLEKYRNAKMSWQEMMLALLGSMGFGMLPLTGLWFRAKTVRVGAEYEVRRFQTIILMERRLPGITVVGLLEDMEVFSRCFAGVLRRCINAYGTGAENSLLRMKQEGACLHESFEELADAFLAVDEVGIELAFAEVESNRRLLEKMSQLEAEISLEEKKDSTDLIAKIPMFLAVGVYFILPFFIHSLQDVYEVFELLEGIQR